MSDTPTPRRTLSPALKFGLELGPLLLFFLVYNRTDIYTSTIVLVGAVLAALAITYALTRHIPTMPLVTAVLVTVFGALTYYLHDATFIKMKATIVYALFAAALLGGLMFGKALLPIMFDGVLKLDEAGWKKLTLRWGLFFIAMALVNEFVWRNFSEDFWVKFKVFGFMPLTALFAIAQAPLMMRHEVKEDEVQLHTVDGAVCDCVSPDDDARHEDKLEHP